MTTHELMEQKMNENITMPNGTTMKYRQFMYLRQCGIITESRFHTTLGKHKGYNSCCIKNFVNLTKLGYTPKLFMSHTLCNYKHHVDYVQCPLCYEAGKNNHTKTK